MQPLSFKQKANIFILTNVILLSLAFLVYFLKINVFGVRFNIAKFAIYTGLFLFTISLLPANIIRLGYNPKWLAAIRPFRKITGIWAGIWVTVHAFLSVQVYYLLPQGYNFLTWFIIPGTITLAIFLALLATSTQWSVRTLKTNWKKLHSLIWITPPLIAYHSFQATTQISYEGTTKWILWAFFIFVFAIVEMIILRQKKNPDLYRHILLLFAGAGLSALIYFFYPHINFLPFLEP